MNDKSDKSAKEQFANYLESKGYTDVKITSSPCDIIAKYNGEERFFELKVTSRKDVYFGAASETEWAKAFNDPDKFKFVVVKRKENGEYDFGSWYSPEEFIKYSKIPPFKVYFNINLKNDKKVTTNMKPTTIKMTKENFSTIKTVFDKIRNTNKNK